MLIALLLLVLPNDVGHPSDRHVIADMREGISFIAHHAIIRPIMILVGAAALFAFSYSVLLPAYATDVLHTDEAGYGVMNTAVGLGALIGSLMVASLSRRGNRGKILTVGSVLFPLALVGLALVHSLPVALVLLFIVGMGFVSQNVQANTLVQTLAPDELRGRVTSVYSLMFFGTAPFGSLMAGAVAQQYGSSPAIAAAAVITLVFALGLILFAPQVRRS